MSSEKDVRGDTELDLMSKKEKAEVTEHSRGHWSNPIEFFLSCLGYAVGLGNIWRFPYLCMRNGGGAFVIPYFLALFLCGMPLFLLEASIGQFAGVSPLQIWEICPLFKGLGYVMLIITAVLSVYYTVIMCWILYYLFKSFTRSLPWAQCANSWNTPLCLVTGISEVETVVSNITGCHNVSLSGGAPDYLTLCSNDSGAHGSLSLNHTAEAAAYAGVAVNGSIPWKSPAEEFWHNNVLELSEGLEDLGGVKWDLCGTLLLTWLIIFCCLFKGVKSLGKVVYVTATIPYVFITALLIRGVTLPGAMDGIKFYIIPDWNKLLEFQVWAEALLQIFYTLGPAWGGIFTMASYNRFHHNCVRDGIVVPIVTCLSSFYAGFVIFSVVGFMAHRNNMHIKDVVATGPGLAFIVYPEAISKMPISPLWAICFFAMMLSVGLDSMFGNMETLVSSITDAHPHYLRRHKTLVAAGISIIMFTLGIMFVTRGGMYLFQVVDWYIVIPSLLVGFSEFIVIAWIYGSDRLCYDIELMTGKRPSLFWRITWKYVSPGLLFTVMIYTFVGLKTPSYDGYEYPLWILMLVWAMNVAAIIPIPLCGVMSLLKQKGSFIQRLRASVQPSTRYGPSDATVRANYDYVGKNMCATLPVNGHNPEVKKETAETLLNK